MFGIINVLKKYALKMLYVVNSSLEVFLVNKNQMGYVRSVKFVLNTIRLLPLVVLCISTYGSVSANPPEKVASVSNHSGSEELSGSEEIFLATLKGDTEEVERLLTGHFISVDVNYTFEQGTTPLMVASAKGFTDIVELLLDRYYKFLFLVRTEKADVNLQDDTGKTALMYASMYGHLDIVSLLLDQDEIDVNIQDDMGLTALMYATLEYTTSENRLKETVRMLLNHKNINTQLRNIDGNTIFDFDMDYSIELLELLNKYLEDKVTNTSRIAKFAE